MKKVIFKIALIFLIYLSLNLVIPSVIAADNNTTDILEEQGEEFGIQDFINDSKEFAGEFFSDIDIGEILDSAIQGKIDNSSIIKKILNLLGSEVVESIKAIGSILAIIVIHAILRAISENLENESVTKLIYYAQYILIITIIMGNFSSIIKMVQDTSTNLVAFMNMLVPLLITLMMYTGSIVTSGVLEPIILFMINFIGNMIQNILIPLVLVFASLVIMSKLSDRVQIDKLAKFLKSGIVWVLGIVLTIFVGVLSLEGTMSSSVDGITAKTAKTIVSSAVPVVGKILSDSVETVLGGGIILKNAVGVVGVIIVLGICIMPIIKLATLTIAYKLLTAITEPIADAKVTSLLDQIGDIFKIFLAILSAMSVMIIVRHSISFENFKLSLKIKKGKKWLSFLVLGLKIWD